MKRNSTLPNQPDLNHNHLNRGRRNPRAGSWRILGIGMALGLGMMGALAPSLPAAPLYWNAAAGSPLTKGPGIWDEGTNSFWSASPAGGPLTTWVADSDAYFMSGGVSTNLGTNLVTISGLVKVGSITQISNYTATTITNTTADDILQIDGAGITNALVNGVANGNEAINIYAPVMLNTNITINNYYPVQFFGGISDGGNGYGIYKAGVGEANSILRFFSNAGNPTQPYTFTGPITIENYRVQLSDPLVFNSAPITIGVPNSGGDFPYLLINEAAADSVYFLGGPFGAQSVMSRPSITVNSPVIYGGATGGNTGIFQVAGVANGANWVECFPSLTLESGMFTGQLTFNTGNLTVYFTNFTRNPGTFLAFARNQNGGTEMFRGLGIVPITDGQSGGGANLWNVVFGNPPPLVGAGGPAGSPTISIWPWADAGDRLATYDDIYGLRSIAEPSDTNYAGECLVISNSMTDGQTNAFIGGAPYYPSGFTMQNNVSVNSLAGAGAIYMNGTNTLSIVSGAIGVNGGMTLGASPNDGTVAFGSATGYSFCQYARTLTINSTITGTGGFTITQDHAGNTSGSVVLNGANTYSGLTKLLANNIGLLTHIGHPLALQNSTLDYNSYGGSLVFQSSLTSATFGGLEGGQTLALTVALTVGTDGDSTTYSGALTGAGSLTKAGPGALTLTGASTHTGGTTLAAGQLNINYGGTSSNSAIGAGTLTLLGGAFDNTTGAAETMAPNNPQIWNGNFTFLGSANLDLGAGQVTLAGNSQVTVNANTLTVDGPIIESGSLTKAGAGALALTGASTYYGNTVISGGTLALTGSAAISATPGITVSNGATLDVSGLGATFTLGGSQKLYAGGTVNGSVNTSSGSAVYAGADGGYGTNTFKNNLTLASGATVNFDLGADANGANDRLVVTGNLTLNGNTLHIKAPSASASLGAADYTLFTVGGTISGSLAATPAWDVQPVNYNQYTVVTSGSTVALHYLTTTLPEGVGSAAPSTVSRNGSTLITVTVTPGSFPVTNVTLNASAVGGSSSLALAQEAANVYTNTVTVGSSLAAGPVSLTASITDNTGSTTLAPVALTIQPGSPVWSGASGTDSNWSDNGNWVGGVGPLSGDNVIFAGTTGLNPVMDQSYTVNSITFSNNAGSFVLTNANSSVLTLAGGGVVNNSGNSQALNVPIFMSASETFNTASGNLAVGGVISGIAPVLNNVGAGALTLSGANTYEGGTTVSSGTLVVANNSALGVGPLTLVGGAVSNAAGISRNVGNNVQLAGTANVAVGPGDTFTLSGVISGSGNVTEVGGGTLALPQGNTCSGSFGVSASTLNYANSTAFGAAVLVLQNGAILTVATTSPSWVIPNAVNLAGQASVTIGSGYTLGFTGVITNVGGFSLSGAGTVTIGGTGLNTYSGGTVLNSPTALDVENPNSPLGAGLLTMAGGYLMDQGPYSVDVTNTIFAQSNTTSWFSAQTQIGTSIFTIGGNLTGSGKVYCTNNNNVFQVTRISGNNSGYTGTFDVTGNNVPTYGVVVFTSPLAGSANANWILENYGSGSVAGQTCAFGNGDFDMGSLAGPGWFINQSNGTTVRLVIGGRNTNATFTGSLITNEINEAGGGPPYLSTGNFSILKVGTGTEYFTAANPSLTNLEVAGGAFDITTGFTTVQAGVPAGGGGLPIPVQVDDGATFGILDAVTGLKTIQTVASIEVGTNAGANLYFSNAYAGGNIVPMNLNGGTMTVNGTCTVILDGNGLAFYAGYSAPLISYSASAGSGQFVLGYSPALAANGLSGTVTNDPANGGLLLNVTQLASLNPTNLTLTTSVAGGVTTLHLSWPSDHLGWALQTNTVGLAVTNAWHAIPASANVTNMDINVNPNQGQEFFRLAE